MTAKPTPPKESPKKSFALTAQEWVAMNKRRRATDMVDADKDMVGALLGGVAAWQKWQDNNPTITWYDFQYLDFIHDVELLGASFAKDTYMGHANFTKTANFKQAKFKTHIDFNNVAFTERADFEKAQFAKEAVFSFATFNENVNFISAKFIVSAIFFAAKFVKQTHFNSATFESSGIFNWAIFNGGKIDFSRMILSAGSNLVFENASFHHAVPDFRYLNRSPDIRFHNFAVVSPKELYTPTKGQIKKEQKTWIGKKMLFYSKKALTTIWLAGFKKRQWDESNEDKYRKLKELAIDNNNYEYELKFYGYEMDSKIINYKKSRWDLNRAKTFFIIKPIQLYRHFSNYGQSMWRPLAWLLALFIAAILHNEFYDYKEFLFRNYTPILPFPFFALDIFSAKHFAFKTLASILWFLLFLDVRNKFRIK